MNSAQENYLKTILLFELEGEQATVTALARNLSLKPASVTEMVKKLSALEYLKHSKYKNFGLTQKGRTVALKILRRHRLWETFLYHVLDYSWSEVHEEAENFEHLISDRLEQRIDKLLDYPSIDPHGHPIPKTNGNMISASNLFTLSDASKGQKVQIMQVNDEDPALLNYLEQNGIEINTQIEISNIVDFDGSMEVINNGKSIFLSPQMTVKILVKQIR